MITAAQLRAARALLGMDQRALAEASGLSLPTIQRMEASEELIRGNVESLMKLIAALDEASIPYAIVGAMALNEYGYRRVTTDVDVLTEMFSAGAMTIALGRFAPSGATK